MLCTVVNMESYPCTAEHNHNIQLSSVCHSEVDDELARRQT